MNNFEEAKEEAGKLRDALYELVKQYEEKYPGVYIESFIRIVIEHQTPVGIKSEIGNFTIQVTLDTNHKPL